MALVIGLAINNGFRNSLQRSLLGATAHVILQERNPEYGIQNWRELIPRLKKLPHVTDVAPGLYGTVLFTGAQSTGGVLKGIPVDQPRPESDILLRLKSGSYGRLRAPGNFPGLIVGSRLAQSTGMLLNSVVSVLSAQGPLTPFGPSMGRERFRVVGIFESGFFDLDSLWAFTSLPSAQAVFGLTDVVNTVELKLDDIYLAPEIAREAEKISGPKLAANTWMEQYGQILSALEMEKLVTAVTIGLIELVAALNILITLTMMVMEKNRDIAVLLSMGARRRQIRRIFIVQGMLIGATGTSLGLALGYSLSYLANHYRWLRLNADIYQVSYVPFEPRLVDGLWIAAAALLVSFVATLYPSHSASTVAPAEALRYE